MNGLDIRALRTRLGLTQKALADILGVNSNTVARWERGELGISAGMTDRLLAMAQSLPSGAAITRTSGVTLDPHHRAILDGLNRRLDPEVFEACAVNLLQTIWRGLVPIRGGRDDGFDGAVADGSSQEPFPLIVTTAKDRVRNIERSLDSAKRAGWEPHRALFATSQRITPDNRRKLRDAARERGVALLQTYDQDWFASRLYHKPEWCKRMLGITGRPHALSVFPVTRRPVLGDDVLGREREMEWLLEARGDCLVVGEPGSGKTFLLRALALQGKALFLVDEDREQIANDLRSLKPEAVIVDDAHIRPTSVGNLTQLRHEVNANFRIIATCWPGEEATLRSSLQIGSPSTLTLDRIDADTMIEIIKSVGIYGPNQLLYAIRSQSAGRPGLAATLAQLCIVSGVATVTSGEGLVDSITPVLDQILGFDSKRVLAPFALGGNSGARQEDVAKHLGMSLLDISSELAKLGAAGIVRVRGDSLIAVEPPPMRWVLVRRVFFGDSGSLPIEPFLSAVGNRSDFLETLIGARSRGADVPNLEQLLEEVNSTRLWAIYASVGPETTRYALRGHPEMIGDLAEPALLHLPEQAIPMLLSRMAREHQTSDSWDYLLRPLEQWIRTGMSYGWNEALNRRQTLVRCIEAWCRRQSPDTAVSIASMRIALNSDFDFETPDPGSGTRITITKATLGATVIQSLATLWPKMMTVVNGASAIPWTVLLELVQGWCHPPLSDDETRTAAHRFLSLMLRDLALASRQYPGVQHCIADIAKRANLTVCTKLDEEFECLYPPQPCGVEDINLEYERLAEDARELAKRSRNRPADDAASVLGRIETESRRAGINHPRFTPEFCRTLADECPEPNATLKVFMRERLPGDLVEPFLRKAVETERDVWPIVSNCLNDELYVVLGVMIAVCHEHAPLEVISSALAKVGITPRLVENLCIRQEVSQVALSEMFRSPDASTTISAAIGHWQAFSHSRTEMQLDKAWRHAFLRSAEARLPEIDCYWIGEILARDSELAVTWLIRFLDSDESSFSYYAQETAKKVIASLDSAQRNNVLTAIHPRQNSFCIPEIVHALVGSNVTVYGQLLRSKKLSYYHLSPLLGKSGSEWRSMAILAFDHGYSCEDVLDANLGGGPLWEGYDSEMWAALRRRYEQFEDDDDSRMVEISHLGARLVAKLEERAKKLEREEAVYGIS